METTREKLKRLSDLLVERGFAKNSIIDYNRGIGSFEWTRSGRSLQKHLRHLFDIPNVSAKDVDGEDIMLVIGTILFTKPD